MTLEFFVVYIPVVLSLLVLFWAVTRHGDRIAALEAKNEAEQWDGMLVWPTDGDIIDGLRSVAGDDDDHRRVQLDRVIAMTERTH